MQQRQQQTLPREDGFLETLPVQLYPHQLTAIRWMHVIETTSTNTTTTTTNGAQRGAQSGGILGDVMGLGKTISTLGLVRLDHFLSGRDDNENNEAEPTRAFAPTLVVTNKSLMSQWYDEATHWIGIARDRVMRALVLGRPSLVLMSRMQVLVYHGAGRETALHERLVAAAASEEDENLCPQLVITTYDTLQKDHARRASGNVRGPSPLYDVVWQRSLLDEAHVARNPKTKTFKALRALRCRAKWAITGTPFVNDTDDVRALSILCTPSRPLGCTGVHDVGTWKQRYMLRRTKEILNLPPLTVVDEWVDWTPDEHEAYHRLEAWAQDVYLRLVESGMLANQYQKILLVLMRLRQQCDHTLLKHGHPVTRAMLPRVFADDDDAEAENVADASSQEPQQDDDDDDHVANENSDSSDQTTAAAGGSCDEHAATGSAATTTTSTIPGHQYDIDYQDEPWQEENDDAGELAPQDWQRQQERPSDDGIESGDDDEDEQDEQDDLEKDEEPEEQEEEQEQPAQRPTYAGGGAEGPRARTQADVTLLLQTRLTGVVWPNEDGRTVPLDYVVRPSCKMTRLCELLDQIRARDPLGKTVVFTQWTAMLDVLENCMTLRGVRYLRYDGGQQNYAARKAVTDLFGRDASYTVLLASLKAGGVGLNLTAARYLFLLEPWWNTAVEQQAFDRIHRIGQTRPVTVYRMLVRHSVEEDMLRVQRKKMNHEAAFFDACSRRVLSESDICGVFNAIRYRHSSSSSSSFGSSVASASASHHHPRAKRVFESV